MNTNQFGWIDFYTEFASKLLGYKQDRPTLIKKLQKVYDDINIAFPKVEYGDEIIDMDPFTVFGLFNKGLTDANRTLIARGIKDSFDIQADVPTEFAGVPVVNNLAATFYYFKGERGDYDIDNLWSVFEAAIQLAGNDTEENRETFSKWYDIVYEQKGIKWNITMALYWIRPYFFVNLDSRNRWYITNPDNMPESFVNKVKGMLKKAPKAKEYLEIRDACKDALDTGKYEYRNFPELSYYAWIVSEKDNQENGRAHSKKTAPGAALADEDIQTIHYWIYSPGDNASNWDEFYDEGIMGIGWDEIGDLRNFSSKEEMKQRMQECIDPNQSFKNGALATWQFVHDMNIGDVIFAKKGMYQVIGRGIVESDYEYRPERETYKNVRRVRWTDKGEWPHPGQAVLKTLTDITKYTDYVDKLNALFEDDVTEDVEEPEISYPAYSEEDFLHDVYMDKTDYETLVGLLKNKKNVILQGAPGVGKTFAAKRLAYSIMGIKDADRVMMVQFHQSYSYEDFIMGFRPTETGFELKKGVFYNFCKTAEDDSDNEYFFIIDEINRGNLSKIFGELFMLIENDKRDISMQLLYSNEKFSVPGNVYIIGMMNTADRSLAMLDYALRRRFAFYEMRPGFEQEGFRNYRMSLNSPKFDSLIRCVERLNEEIAEDESLGEGFCIGHSYFCNLDEVTDQVLSSIVEYEIIPLLKEYWFDEPGKVKDWSDALRSSIK